MRRTGCSLLFDIIISFMLGFFVSLVSAITVLFVFCSQSKEDRVLFVSLPHREQAVQACINHVGYFTKVFGSIFKTNVVTVNNNKFSFIVFYPVLVTLLQSCQMFVLAFQYVSQVLVCSSVYKSLIEAVLQATS